MENRVNWLVFRKIYGMVIIYMLTGDSFSIKNAGNRSSPRTRFSRAASDYDLHEKAGGLPLPTITVPNVHLSSKRRREVYKQAGKSNFPK